MVESARIDIAGADAAEIFKKGGGDFPGGAGSLEKARFSGVSTDSRGVGPGELFFALVGENFDGHDFIVDAVKKGAGGLVVQKDRVSKIPKSLEEIPMIAVGDTLVALGELAALHRGRMKAAVVGITGSNGKTTTKEMTASVAAVKFATEKSEGNFNNLIGLPMTLLSMTEESEVIVLEMGMNVPGEMKRLVEIARPDIGVITNIGPVHLEGVGSVEGVMREKGHVVTGLPADGTAVINGDCKYCRQIAADVKAKVITFGLDGERDVTAINIEELGGEGTRAEFLIPGDKFTAGLKVPGVQNLKNGLAAVSVGVALGMSADEIKVGIEAVKSIRMRMEMVKTEDGLVVLNDSYNANPVSVKAAIRFLAKEAADGGGRLIAVLGDMLELGDYAVKGHEEVGAEAADAEASYLFLLGDSTADTARGAKDGGISEDNIFTYPVGGHEELIGDLRGVVRPKDRIVVKGSRGMKMETVVSGIMSWGKP